MQFIGLTENFHSFTNSYIWQKKQVSRIEIIRENSCNSLKICKNRKSFSLNNFHHLATVCIT